MNKLRDRNLVPVEPFADRLGTLFGELELAAMWERPSILFAVYSSEYTRAEAQAELEKQLAAAKQTICHLDGACDSESSLVKRIKAAHSECKSIVFVEGVCSAEEDCGKAFLEQLNCQRDDFIQDGLRVIFWLNESQVCDLANCAPDLWSFRHRVVEFPDVPEPESIIVRTLDAAWQGSDESAGIPDPFAGGINISDALLNRLPQGEESTGVYVNLLLTLGVMHWRKKDPDRAEEFIKAASEIAEVTGDEKLLAECLNAAALVRISQQRYEEAVETYQRSLQVSPAQAFPWGHLGNLYSKLGRDHEAISAFKKALENQPEDAFSWQGMGDVYDRLQLSKPAIEHYQKAVDLSPNLVAAWLGLAKVHTDRGEPDKAAQALARCLEIDSQNKPAWLQLARLHAEGGRTEQAVSAYLKLIELDPKSLPAMRGLGEVYLGARMNEDAITAFRGAIALEPDSGLDYRNLGMAHFQNGDFSEAVLLFRKSLDLTSVPALRAEINNRLGDAYRGLQQYDKAVEAYQAADQLTRTKPAGPKSEQPATPMADEDALTEPQLVPSAEESGIAIAPPIAESAPDLWSFEKAALSLESARWLNQDTMSSGVNADAAGMISQPVTVTALPPQGPPSFLDGEQQEPTTAMPTTPVEPGPDDEVFDPQAPPAATPEAGSTSEEAEYWNNLGNQLLSQGSYAEAISAYTYAIELSPEISWPYIRNLTTAHYRKGKARGQEQPAPEVQVDKTAADTPREAEILPASAPPPVEAPSPDMSPSGHGQAPHDVSGNQSVHRLLQQGNEQLRLGQYDDAVQTYVKAIEKQPDFGWAYCNLGIAYSHLGKNTYAVLALKKGIDYLEGDKEKALGWRHLSEVYADVGDPVNANYAMETALTLEREKTSILQRARVMLLGSNA
jgi:tetratricopeptide (TPR) repeat protein